MAPAARRRGPDRNGDILERARGIAYAQRSGAVVAIVAERREIDRPQR